MKSSKPNFQVSSSIFKIRGKERSWFSDSRSDEFVCIIQWMEKKIVYFALNHCQIQPTKSVKCYSQQAEYK